MAKYSSQLVQFKLPYERHQKAKKEAQRRGFKSPGLYAKELFSSSLLLNSEEEFKQDIVAEINELKDDVDRLWETLEREQRQQRQFRKRMDDVLIAILEQLQKPSPMTTISPPDSRSGNRQKQSLSVPEKNPLDERYARIKR